jgi:hypothetical protein
MTPWPGEATVLRRVRVLAAGLDPLAARVRAGALLGAAGLRAAGLPPSAVVCVRRLADPLPGALGLRRGGVRPSPAWERAAGEALDRLARSAARPARGPVPPSAEAVVFADPAELLACLAADWCDGFHAARWWWRALLGAALDRPLSAWLGAPEHAPAALAQLAETGRAREFVRALPEVDAVELRRRALAAHGLPRLSAALDRATGGGEAPLAEPGRVAAEMAANDPAPPPPSRDSTPGDGQPDVSRPLAATTLRAAPPPPPWLPRVPEADAGLGPGRQALLGIGLLLHRAPHVVRSAAFAAAVERWRAASAPTHERIIPPTPSDPPPSIRPPAPAAKTNDSRPRGAGQPDLATRTDETGSVGAGAGGIPPTDAAPKLTTDCHQPTNGLALVETAPPAIAAPRMSAAPAAGVRGEVIDTGLAGVFFLVNVGLALGLYGDFTSPARPGIELPVWDFLALVGGGLLGPGHEGDPVWALLARLAGRADDEPPGSGFAPPEDWRVPADWLRPFPGLVVPLREGGPIPPAGATACERWLSRLLPYVRARLALALAAADAEVAPLLLARPGRVFVTGAHLDVTLSLADLPVAVRLAGLDRDPGWVPAAGRVVAFHFD